MGVGAKVLAAGIVIAVVFPTVAILALGAKEYLRCNTPRLAPCLFHGIPVGWIGDMGTGSVIASFVSVPLGLLLCAAGLVALLVDAVRGARRRAAPSGVAPPPVDAPSAGARGWRAFASRWKSPRALAWLAVQVAVAVLAIKIFYGAAEMAAGSRFALAQGKAMPWQIGAEVGAVLAVLSVLLRPRHTVYMLFASSVFLFSSCTANFRWAGG